LTSIERSLPFVRNPQGWNTSQLNIMEANLPRVVSRQVNSPAALNIAERYLPPSISRRVHPNPDPTPNPFSTGSLIEALAAPSSASRNGPAKAIKPRKGGHKRQSPSGSRHPSSPSRREEAARAAAVAAMYQALSVQQGPTHRSPSLATPRVSARKPLGAARQPGLGETYPSAGVQPEQGPATPQGRTIERGRRVAAMYPMAHVQGHRRGIYQAAQPIPTRYDIGPVRGRATVETRARNAGPYPSPY
jgi:hypothetical protein